MPGLRDHSPFVIEEFNGWWNRGDNESAPSDHFIVADNVQYFNSGVETRNPLDTYQNIATPLTKVLRMYGYVMQTGQTLLVLTEGGKIYHIKAANEMLGPILTIPTMTDFGFVAIAGRAYITPFQRYRDVAGRAYQAGVRNYELGIKNEFLYVYKGDGTQARKAAGPPPTGSALVAALDVAGLTDTGIHLIAVVYETDTGYMTALGPEIFAQLNFDGTHKILVSNIPVGPAYVKKRHLVSTKAITDYNNDQKGYQFFFIPEGELAVGEGPTKLVQFFDIDLVSDASHLIDNFSEIPAGVTLNTYHSRLVIVGEFGLEGPPITIEDTLKDLPEGITDNRSVARVSHPNEPEAISKVDGLIIAPLDGNPLTNVQEFRDVLYLYKKTRTFAYVDNSDEPSTWAEEVIDQGTGAPVHGVAAVLDSGGVNIDFLFVADLSGLMLFNGVYARPELSFKIEDYWMLQNRNESRFVQIVNDSLSKKIWITLPPPNQHIMLHADYANAVSAKDIRWARWIFDVKVSTITLSETNILVVGAVDGVDPSVPSGIYFINPVKIGRHDSYYGGVERKIPNPTIKLALIGV